MKISVSHLIQIESFDSQDVFLTENVFFFKKLARTILASHFLPKKLIGEGGCFQNTFSVEIKGD